MVLLLALQLVLQAGGGPGLLRGATGEPPTRQELGRAGWLVLHKIATTYEAEPASDDQLRLRRFIGDWAKLYPCGECSQHFQRLIQESPPDVSSRKGFMLWLCGAHNAVNRRLGKRRFSCTMEELEERWGGCGCVSE